MKRRFVDLAIVFGTLFVMITFALANPPKRKEKSRDYKAGYADGWMHSILDGEARKEWDKQSEIQKATYYEQHLKSWSPNNGTPRPGFFFKSDHSTSEDDSAIPITLSPKSDNPPD